MATKLNYLQAVNAYPIPQATLESIALQRGVELDSECTMADTKTDSLLLAKADILSWLANAPSITQGGQSYSFSEEQRTTFLANAKAIYNEVGDSGNKSVVYGYKGSRL